MYAFGFMYAFGELVDNSSIIAKNTALDKGEGQPDVESFEED